ncbi:hypothetical protein FSG97_017055, partial [Escherichia coli]|nr:hypothetical protein [Escherichia coli]
HRALSEHKTLSISWSHYLRHERSSLPLGKFLVTEGVISQETLDRVLTIQRELQVSMQSLLLKAGLNTEQVAQLESENEGE